MLKFMDEERVKKGIQETLQSGETLQSVGKAMNRRWGFRYYTGFTNNRAVLFHMGRSSTLSQQIHAPLWT